MTPSEGEMRADAPCDSVQFNLLLALWLIPITTWYKAHFLYYIWSWMDVPSVSIKSLLSYLSNSVPQSYSLDSHNCAAVAVKETTYCCPPLDSTASHKTNLLQNVALYSQNKYVKNDVLQWLDKKSTLVYTEWCPCVYSQWDCFCVTT